VRDAVVTSARGFAAGRVSVALADFFSHGSDSPTSEIKM